MSQAADEGSNRSNVGGGNPGGPGPTSGYGTQNASMSYTQQTGNTAPTEGGGTEGGDTGALCSEDCEKCCTACGSCVAETLSAL